MNMQHLFPTSVGMFDLDRPLTDEEVASILDYAARYVGYRLDYMDPPPSRSPRAGEGRG